ncbi:hypothetical protein CLU81_4729 [Flavobacterium sp. 9]|uniref:hypothetical protein n=1 Tax=Flavobacterium sp. 9 TaxID=2035198 RepID=UPI000C1A69D7|nr:hypothetical protein [Flavobacterium sp. 9]PIF34095.1 hypothetical protein CLU81_4729 [Flavobacterium sp. 9]
MNKIVRILRVTFNFKIGNLTYKIAYLRNINDNDYDMENGDVLDQAIFVLFSAKNPTNIIWEYFGRHNQNIDLSRYSIGFSSKNIPLIISAKLSESLSLFELDDLANKGTVFTDQNRTVKLFFRTNVNEEHDFYSFLPTSIRVAIDRSIYIDLAQTILPLV